MLDTWSSADWSGPREPNAFFLLLDSYFPSVRSFWLWKGGFLMKFWLPADLSMSISAIDSSKLYTDKGFCLFCFDPDLGSRLPALWAIKAGPDLWTTCLFAF